MQRSEEPELVRAARSGDRSAFAVLVERYWDRIRYWIYAQIGNAHAAEDLTQEVFLKAWTKLPELRADGQFRGWLFRVARNEAFDSRKGPRGARIAQLPPGAVCRQAGPLAAAVEREGQQQFRDACERLPMNYRAAYLLWAREGMSYSEIALALGITEVTARWRVCKARARLVNELRPFLGGPEGS